MAHGHVVEDAATVIAQVFDEAERCDLEHEHTWIALVDGNSHQINRIRAEAEARSDEYLGLAAWSFFAEGDAAAEAWALGKVGTVLAGKAGITASVLKLEQEKRTGADRCAVYLLRKRPYLDYATALRQGWPIATDIIEGACRHLVKDRMDITGTRWGMKGAEAVLRLRALRQNGDFAACLTRE